MLSHVRATSTRSLRGERYAAGDGGAGRRATCAHKIPSALLWRGAPRLPHRNLLCGAVDEQPRRLVACCGSIACQRFHTLNA